VKQVLHVGAEEGEVASSNDTGSHQFNFVTGRFASGNDDADLGDPTLKRRIGADLSPAYGFVVLQNWWNNLPSAPNFM
jgi:hypothetical protein